MLWIILWITNKSYGKDDILVYTDKEELLTKAKTLLQSEVTSISYNTWIKNLKIANVSGNKITLIAQSKMQSVSLSDYPPGKKQRAKSNLR